MLRVPAPGLSHGDITRAFLAAGAAHRNDPCVRRGALRGCGLGALARSGTPLDEGGDLFGRSYPCAHLLRRDGRGALLAQTPPLAGSAYPGLIPATRRATAPRQEISPRSMAKRQP